MASIRASEDAANGALAGVRRPSWISLLAVAVAPVAILSLLITGAIIIGFIPFHLTDQVVAGLELLDIVLGMTLAALVAARWLKLWSERRKGTAGARLHFRLVALFSVI